MGLLDTLKEWHESGIDVLGATAAGAKQATKMLAAIKQAADKHRVAAGSVIAAGQRLATTNPKLGASLVRAGQHHAKKADAAAKGAAATITPTAAAALPTKAKALASGKASPMRSASAMRTNVHGADAVSATTITSSDTKTVTDLKTLGDLLAEITRLVQSYSRTTSPMYKFVAPGKAILAQAQTAIDAVPAGGVVDLSGSISKAQAWLKQVKGEPAAVAAGMKADAKAKLLAAIQKAITAGNKLATKHPKQGKAIVSLATATSKSSKLAAAAVAPKATAAANAASTGTVQAPAKLRTALHGAMNIGLGHTILGAASALISAGTTSDGSSGASDDAMNTLVPQAMQAMADLAVAMTTLDAAARLPGDTGTAFYGDETGIAKFTSGDRAASDGGANALLDAQPQAVEAGAIIANAKQILDGVSQTDMLSWDAPTLNDLITAATQVTSDVQNWLSQYGSDASLTQAPAQSAWGGWSSLAATGSAWAPNTPYAVAASVTNNGITYRAATAGTSAATGTGPAGTTPNTPIQDGTVTWMYVGGSQAQGTGTASGIPPGLAPSAQWMPNTSYATGTQVTNYGNNYQALNTGRSGVQGGPMVTSGTTTDGTMQWGYMGPAAGATPMSGGPWMPNTYYPSGATVTNPMGSSYQAMVAGTSGATPPMSTTGMVQDGTIQWMYAGGQMPMDPGGGYGGGGGGGGGDDGGGSGGGGGADDGDDGGMGPSDFGPSGGAGDPGAGDAGGDDGGGDGSPFDPGLSAASQGYDPFADDDSTSADAYADANTEMTGDVSFEWYDVLNPAGGVIRNIDQNENKPNGGSMTASGTSRVLAAPAFTADQQARVDASRQRLAQINQQRATAYTPTQVATFMPPPPSSGFADRLSASKGFLAQSQGDAMQGEGEDQEDPPEQGYTLREEMHDSAQAIVDAFDGVAPGPDASLAPQPGGLELHEAGDIVTSPWNTDITDTPADPQRRTASLHLGAGYLQTLSYPRGGASSGQEGGSMTPKETIQIYGESSGSTYDRGADVLGVLAAPKAKPVPRAQFSRGTTPAGNKFVSMKVNQQKKGDNKKSVANARDAAKRAIAIGTKLKKAAKATNIKGAVAPVRAPARGAVAHGRPTARHHLTAAQIAKLADSAIKAGTDASKHADKHDKLYKQNDHKKVLGVAAVKKVLAQSGATKVHGDDEVAELFRGVQVLGHSVTLLGEAAIAEGLRTSPGFLDDVIHVFGDAAYGLTSSTPIAPTGVPYGTLSPYAAPSPYGTTAPSPYGAALPYDPANPPDPNNPGYLSDGSMDPSAGTAAGTGSTVDLTAGPPTADSVKLQPGVDFMPDPHPDGNDQNQYNSLPQGAVVYLGDSPKGNTDFIGSWNRFFGGGDGYFFGKQGWIYFQGDDWSPKKTSGDFTGAVQQIYAESLGKKWGPLIGNPKKPNDADWANGLRFDKSSGSLFWFYDKAPPWATENDNQVRLNQAILDYKAQVAAAAADAAAAAAQDQLDAQNAAQLQKQQAADDAQMAHQQEQDQAQAESDSQIQAKADDAASREQQAADESMARQAAAQAELDVKAQESDAEQARQDALTQAQIDQQALETRARLGLPIESGDGGGAGDAGGGLDDGGDMSDTGGEPTDTGESDTELSGSARVRQHLQY